VTTELFTVTEDQQAIRQAIREIAEGEIAPHAADVDEHERYPVEAQKALTAAGFQAVHIAEEYDGAGADAVTTVIVIEEVARVCASSSLIPAVNKLGSMPIILSGSEELKQLVLPTIASGEAMISYALSEREAGSDAAAMRTRAVADGDDWVLNGTKCWITNAGISSWYTVMAVTDPEKRAKGISAFVVHADDPGFVVGSKERKLGIKGSPTREIHFENCRIPGSRIIGDPGTGFSTAMATLDHTRPTIGAQAIGIAQGALDVAVAYVKERKQFGTPVGAYQAVSHRCAQMLLDTEIARAATSEAAWTADADPDRLRECAALAKATASDAGRSVTASAIQAHGGIGFTWEADVHWLFKRAQLDAALLGGAKEQRARLARFVGERAAVSATA
jgi:alkylation response protein AidB-like acyl-CoA dehydrogenase